MGVLTLLSQWLGFARHQTTLLVHPLVLSLLFIFSAIILLSLINRSFAKKPNLPPSPPKIPILGNLHQLGSLLHRSLHNLSKKYGPLMFVHLGYAPILIVSSAEMVREITVNHGIAFANRPLTMGTNLLLYGSKSLAFSPYGEFWMQLRKISVTQLLSNKRVQSFKNVRQEEVAFMIEKITRSCSLGEPVNVSEFATALSNDIVCRCGFGRKHGGQDGNANFGLLAGELLNLVTSFSFGDTFPWLAWMDNLTGLIRRMKKVSRELDSFIDQIIEEHLLTKNRHDPHYHNEDFVHILLQIQEDDINFKRDHVKALILDMIIAGTETVSTAIAWTMAELVKNPILMQKAQEEVRRVIGNKNKVDEENIHQMDYLKSVVKETLRFHPPAAVTILQSSTATNVKGYHVPARTRVIVNIWSIQRDSTLWEKPDEFNPDRFINNPIDFLGNDCKLIPFGFGRRACPGMSFGNIALELAIANLLYWFDWETPGGEEIDMTEHFGFSLTLKTPLQLVPISHFS